MNLLIATTLLVLPTPVSLGDGAPPSDWRQRATAAADRLAVAAVDASGNSVDARQLWYGSEGQQVLELLDGKACLARRSTVGDLVCHFGGPAPIGAWPHGTALDDRGRRIQFARHEGFLHLSTELRDGGSFLLAWRADRPSLDPAPPVAAAPPIEVLTAAEAPALSAVNRVGWGVAGGAFLAILCLLIRGRRQGLSQLAEAQWSARLASQECRAEAAEARIGELIEQQRIALLALAQGERPDWGDPSVAAAADHLVEEVRGEALRLDRETVALVAAMGCTEQLGPAADRERWSIPLEQLSTLLAQVAGRLDGLAQGDLADQLRMRRAGMLRFTASLEQHLQASVRLSPEAWRGLWQASERLVIRSAELSRRVGVRNELPVLPVAPSLPTAHVTPFPRRDESTTPGLRRSQAS
jgi:hypothetical protein